MTQLKSKMPEGHSSKTDVIELLVADHQKVKNLFKEFEALKDKNDNPKKTEIVDRLCLELTIHMRAEEEILYPAARKAIYNEDLMDEADVEHAATKELIAQLEMMSPDESHYDAKVIVLSESITHHVKEEEGEMFPIRNMPADRVSPSPGTYCTCNVCYHAAYHGCFVLPRVHSRPVADLGRPGLAAALGFCP